MKHQKRFCKKSWFWLIATIIILISTNGQLVSGAKNDHANEARSTETTVSRQVKEQEVQGRKHAKQRRLARLTKQQTQLTYLKKYSRRQRQPHKRTVAVNKRSNRTVYIAPASGKRYHYSSGCRGLTRAHGHITKTTLRKAAKQGYTHCRWEK